GLPYCEQPQMDFFPEWGFDGSSTSQSSGDNSDLLLKPVYCVTDPLRGKGNYCLLCEVYDAQGQPHLSNTRAPLRQLYTKVREQHDPWVGFEQEYTLFEGTSPLGWPVGGFPPPQGPFYCGVGAKKVHGRDMVEMHTKVCLAAGLMVFGTNAEVMPSQWEFQVGYRGFPEEVADPLTVSDHLWLSRWFLFRIGEEYGIEPSFANKPIKGDWNGAGNHTNFSTTAMREPNSGKGAIEQAIQQLAKTHTEHIAVYGAGLEERLTGLHETCNLNEFKSGTADRSASIRVPLRVAQKGYGYLEDRRPGANADPYRVCTRLIETICL
ncbi:MAG: glutamine synthetase beta-grasp domain-containing protein, partial [Zetaproteobacteria bacterium]|nr:glutamine synthetase beta-grasp domain-containing protein [Zetaproteobacteria bacterium]